MMQKYEEEYKECVNMTEEEAQAFIEAGENQHFKEVHPDYRHRHTMMAAVVEVKESKPQSAAVYQTQGKSVPGQAKTAVGAAPQNLASKQIDEDEPEEPEEEAKGNF
jgi:hypothetical protein